MRRCSVVSSSRPKGHDPADQLTTSNRVCLLASSPDMYRKMSDQSRKELRTLDRAMLKYRPRQLSFDRNRPAGMLSMERNSTFR
jgi:hypothetical protein